MSLSNNPQFVPAEEFSCGFLVFREYEQRKQFLLMKHQARWDLPKGHVDEGETNQQCALRELWEETGIQEQHIIIDPEFEFIHRYYVLTRSGKKRLKELTIYLATLLPQFAEIEIKPTEHLGSEWFDWQPPHEIESRTIDGLLAAVAEHF